MSEENPMMTSAMSASPSTYMRKYHEGDPFGHLSRSWPCARCGCLLGIIHLSFAIFVLIFDIFTNEITYARFSTSAAILYFICALLCFIAVRRLDRAAQIILLTFTVLSILASIALFVQNAHIVNQICVPDSCEFRPTVTHAVFIVVGLSEGVTCFITMILCYRSLRMAFKVQRSFSPYSTLIVGDYKQLYMNPPVNNPHFNMTASTTFLQ